MKTISMTCALLCCVAGLNRSVLAEPPEHDAHHAPAAKAETKAEGKTEAKAEPKTAGRLEPKPFARSRPTPEAKPEAKPETKADEHAKPETKPEPKADPKAETPKVGKSANAKAAETPTGDQALAMLQEGNARWIGNHTENPATEPARRQALAQDGQHPFATVLTCADSRLPVERVFDRGVGDIFSIRVAGNVAGESETGTVEYGVGHLHTPLLVVMGHTRCGAVGACVSHADVGGHIAGLLNHINPAVERATRLNPGASSEEIAAAAVRENVWQTVFDLLKQSPEVRESVAKGELKVVGAVCDISTGKVDFLGEHPWQAELVAALGAQPNSEHTADASGSHEPEAKEGH